jgi:hypothetical protein
MTYFDRTWDNVVGIETCCGLDTEETGVQVLVGIRFFCFSRPD